MKKILKKLLPERLFLFYHYLMAVLSAVYYGWPSRKMIVIGVTGTKGKTSTANFIWSCLEANGYKTGMISTANIKIGQKEFLNKYHMTMPGRFTIQRLLKEMTRQNCHFAIIEATSEGIKQFRHKGINFDIVVFTNLFPEHLTSHGGSFVNYKNAKGKLFACLNKPKFINGKKIDKAIIANFDSEHKDYFLNFKTDKKITFGLKDGADFQANNISETPTGVKFSLKDKNYLVGILGGFNVYNVLPAIIISQLFGGRNDLIQKGVEQMTIIPGRMEIIDKGQNFKVIVDYAHEKESITKVLKTAKNLKTATSKIIILLGAEGGGRDKTKRPIMGELAAKYADYVVVSNVDPYEDEPKQIIEDIAAASEKFGKIRDKDLFLIEDRRNGIAKALSLAYKDDIVLITGKGAEQSIIINGKNFPWDDRIVAREELGKLGKS